MTYYGITPTARLIRLGDWRELAAYARELDDTYCIIPHCMAWYATRDGGHRRNWRVLTGAQLALTWPAWEAQR